MPEPTKISTLPYYWKLLIKGEVHYSNKRKICPRCGAGLKVTKNQYECLKGCSVYID